MLALFRQPIESLILDDDSFFLLASLAIGQVLALEVSQFFPKLELLVKRFVGSREVTYGETLPYGFIPIRFVVQITRVIPT